MTKYFIAKEYFFKQDTPASVWVINHTCGFPAVDIYVDNNGTYEKIIPFEIKFLSNSVCEVHFTKPFAGLAKIVG